MECEANKYNLLEQMLLDASQEPTDLPLSLLKDITDNFSEDRKIGSGGFAVVYEGILHNGSVAVKRLSQAINMDESNFHKEVTNLMRVKPHQNVVRFLGYCADTQGKVDKYGGKMVMADVQQRLLCFEFLPNGCLDKHINNVASGGLEWRTCYQIIKGLCRGLHHLHQQNIVHLDLKPANILLDYNMVPKISDFGLSRCFDEKQTRAITANVVGTMGYMAPEFINSGVITIKSDIYSLGIIIIEILTGQKGYLHTETVLQSWSNRFKPAQEDILLHHVQVCAEIGNQCIEPNPEDRPDTLDDIIKRLDEIEPSCGYNETDIRAPSATKVLDIYPLDIWFPPFEPNNGIKCPVTLTNRTDDLIGVCIKPMTFADARSSVGYPYVWELRADEESESIRSVGEHDPTSSAFIRLGSHSSVIIYMTMRNQQQPLLQGDKDMFDVVMVAMKSLEDLEYLGQLWSRSWRSITNSWRSIIKELGTLVHRATLRVAVTTARCQHDVVAVHQFAVEKGPSDYPWISCTDVHPTKPWLLVGYYSSGHVSIWNYETQDRIIRLEVVTQLQESGILSIKFIAGEDWFAAGDNNGRVHVYAYTTSPAENDKVKELKAHGDKTKVSSLAAYPKHTLLLTASWDDKSIKLWDWSQGWTCARVIAADTAVHLRLVGPRDTSIFAYTTDDDNLLMVCDITHPPAAMGPFRSSSLTFCTDCHRDFLAFFDGYHTITRSHIKIWDLETKEHVHSLYLKIGPWPLYKLAGHPTLPILAGIIKRDGSKVQIVLWDVRTYRVMKCVELLIDDLRFPEMLFDRMEDITSLVVFSEFEISIIKINVPMLLTGC